VQIIHFIALAFMRSTCESPTVQVNLWKQQHSDNYKTTGISHLLSPILSPSLPSTTAHAPPSICLDASSQPGLKDVVLQTTAMAAQSSTAPLPAASRQLRKLGSKAILQDLSGPNKARRLAKERREGRCKVGMVVRSQLPSAVSKAKGAALSRR
jgi:hypothetical protein